MLGFLENYIKDLTQKVEQPLSLEDIQYTEEFEAVENEIQKLQGVVPETPDWQLILDMGKTVLTTQGKHIKIVTYVVVALYQKYKIAGLLAGLYIFSDLLSLEKDNIMPYGKRKKSRINLVMWMVKFIADYREKNPQDLQLKDLDNVEQSKQAVVEWFNEFHPNDDTLALMHIYDWFVNAKNAIENEDRIKEQKRILAQKEQERLKKEQEEQAEIERQKEQEEAELAAQQEFESEFEEEEYEHGSIDSSHQELNIQDMSSVREYIVSELLDRLAFCKDDQQALFSLMTQSRKVLWNTLYYDSLVDEIPQMVISADFADLNQILCIADPLARIAELERLFIKNPFLIDIQMYILKALDDLQMRLNDLSCMTFRKAIVSDLSLLLNECQDLFELSYVERQCIPEYIYDWVFTQIFDDIVVFNHRFDEYIENFDIETQHLKILEYVKSAKSLNLKMSYLLQICNNKNLSVSSKISIIEQSVNDDALIIGLIRENSKLRQVFRSLTSLYNEHINETDNKALIKRNEDIMKKIDL
ncbi:hypothetical protein LO80_01615 [Candidatus Francisella endociliophora]|uniref:ImpA N-terminal domain-containing protein n=1 Tax=Candidatus Francisella endociliophora TaxID=653937 RepID=A0A097EMK0_9GAMM|nr:type VI secretion system ImpA family N-terminal domain-containing protein [Francisella sp. FSC1006]AIT08799.1 hypothetical protein LO80_01615 [Francisella sp. FSC1006]